MLPSSSTKYTPSKADFGEFTEALSPLHGSATKLQWAHDVESFYVDAVANLKSPIAFRKFFGLMPKSSKTLDFGTPISHDDVSGSPYRRLFDQVGSPQDFSSNFGHVTPGLITMGHITPNLLVTNPTKEENKQNIPPAFRSSSSYKLQIDPHKPGLFNQKANQVNHLLWVTFRFV